MACCTVCKGALQDLTDNVRYAHRVPEEVQCQAGKAHSSVDSDAKSLYGVADIPSLRNIERHTAI